MNSPGDSPQTTPTLSPGYRGEGEKWDSVSGCVDEKQSPATTMSCEATHSSVSACCPRVLQLLPLAQQPAQHVLARRGVAVRLQRVTRPALRQAPHHVGVVEHPR